MNMEELGGIDPRLMLECLELIDRQPDDDLLSDYYRCQMTSDDLECTLTVQQRKWIETNLAYHPQWQLKYAQIVERNTRRRTRLPSNAIVLVAVAATVLLVAPLWFNVVVSSRSQLETQLVELLDVSGDVVRGSHNALDEAPPPDALGEFASLSDLRDALATMSDSTKISQTRRALQTHYESSPDPYHRAELALRLAKLGILLDDPAEAEYWREKCAAEETIECAR